MNVIRSLITVAAGILECQYASGTLEVEVYIVNQVNGPETLIVLRYNPSVPY